jgi:hypothetical protein
MRRLLLAALVGLAMVPAATATVADEPVTLNVSVPAVVASNVPFAVGVSVAADPGALGSAPMRVRVRAATECGASFDSTAGAVLLDKQLGPSGKVAGRGLTHSFGSFTACAFLEQQGDDRLFAFDDSATLAVTHPCTTYTRRVISTKRALKKVRKQLRRARGKAHRGALMRRSAHLRTKLKRAGKAQKRACTA